MNRIDIDPASFANLDARGESAWNDYTASAVHFRFQGVPTVMGRYYTVGRVCYAQIRVDPGTALTTYAASSFVTLPIQAQGFTGNASFQQLAPGNPNHTLVGAIIVSTSVVRLEDSPSLSNPIGIFVTYEI